LYRENVLASFFYPKHIESIEFLFLANVFVHFCRCTFLWSAKAINSGYLFRNEFSLRLEKKNYSPTFKEQINNTVLINEITRTIQMCSLFIKFYVNAMKSIVAYSSRIHSLLVILQTTRFSVIYLKNIKP